MLWPLGYLVLVDVEFPGFPGYFRIFMDVLVFGNPGLYLSLIPPAAAFACFCFWRLNENMPHEPSQELSDEKVREIVAASNQSGNQ